MTKKTDNNTVELDNPIVRGTGESTQKITKVTLRKPRAGELRGLRLGDVATLDVNALITLIPRITEPVINETEVADMDIEDITAIGAKIQSFLEQKKDSLIA